MLTYFFLSVIHHLASGEQPRRQINKKYLKMIFLLTIKIAGAILKKSLETITSVI